MFKLQSWDEHNLTRYSITQQTGCSRAVALAERSHVKVKYHWFLLDATHFNPDDQQKQQLEFENRKQKTENRKQKTQNRKQKTENRKQKTENRKQKTENTRQKTENRKQKTQDRKQIVIQV